VAIVLALLGAAEAGYRVAAARRGPAKDDTASHAGGIMAATLGLLAFMLAFTFGMGGSRFDARKQLVQEEANAITAAYLRAELLEAERRDEIQRLLREHVQVRLDGVRAGGEAIVPALARSEHIQAELWEQALGAAQSEEHKLFASLFIQSLQAVFDYHNKRVRSGLRDRIPPSIWATLGFIAALAMTAMGYHAGLTGTRNAVAALALVLTFAAVLSLIVDLDRPEQTLFGVSQQASVDLLDRLGPRPIP
jgi:hypothetical protein